MSVGEYNDRSVTVIVSQLIKPGCEADFEQWLRGISEESAQFPGHLGTNVIKPSADSAPEYVVVFRFDRYSNLKVWMDSSARQHWLGKLKKLVQKDPDIRTMDGLDFWVALPNKPMRLPPPRYKTATITAAAVYTLLNVLTVLLTPVIGGLPFLLRSLVLVVLVVILLTFWLMPLLTKLLHKWLYPTAKT